MKKIFSFLLIFCLFSLGLFSQTVFRVTVPINTPVADNVYIAGDFNGWNPADETCKLQKTESGIFIYSTTTNSGTIHFKYTRGSWEKVEKAANCEEIANRIYTFSATDTTDFQVVNWRDICDPSGGHTAQTNVTIMSDNFYMPQLNRSRRIWIYLPLDYETTNKHYPVLYMHDGQNLFDAATSFSGEWEIDESLNQLYSDGDSTAIVVGIDNGGSNRIGEYTPWANATYGGGGGEKYIQFIVETLKPHIDSVYRTKPQRDFTGICGSSLGGLISWYAGLEYQNVFSKIGVFSPSFWFSDSCYTYARQSEQEFPTKMYFLAGGQESTEIDVIADAQRMIDTLQNAGFEQSNMYLAAKPDGQHREWFWRREFPDSYIWLNFGIPTGIESNASSNEFHPFFAINPQTKHLSLINNDTRYTFDIELFNLQGQRIFIRTNIENSNLDSLNLKSGIYIARYRCGQHIYNQKIVIEN